MESELTVKDYMDQIATALKELRKTQDTRLLARTLLIYAADLFSDLHQTNVLDEKFIKDEFVLAVQIAFRDRSKDQMAKISYFSPNGEKTRLQ